MNQNENAEAQSPPRKHKWTMTHSYWAVAGGIAVDVNGSEPLYSTGCRPTLTENGILLLLKTDPELLPDIPESDIKDVSRHHSLARLLAGIQTIWFCVSCVVRVAQRFPLSLLELITFIHAMCTIIVYIVWWKKPLGLKRQFLITSDRFRPLVAFMWMASHASARDQTDEDLKDMERTYTYSHAPEFEAIYLGKFCEDDQASSVGSSRRMSAEPATITVTPERGLVGTTFFVNRSSARWTVKSETIRTEDGPPVERNTRQDPAVFVLTRDDARRWRLAYEAMRKYGLRKPTIDHGYITNFSVSDMIYSAPSEWTENIPASALNSLFAILGICLLACAVGTLYALAWNTRFPSRTQRIMWRISALVVACTAGVALSFVIFLVATHLLAHGLGERLPAYDSTTRTASKELQSTSTSDEKLASRQPSQRSARFGSSIFESSAWKSVASIAKVVYKAALSIFAYLWSWAYIVSRAYLFGESFRMVFYLPPDTLRATPWEKYFPHIG
jgi:hypothetical protein